MGFRYFLSILPSGSLLTRPNQFYIETQTALGSILDTELMCHWIGLKTLKCLYKEHSLRMTRRFLGAVFNLLSRYYRHISPFYA